MRYQNREDHDTHTLGKTNDGVDGTVAVDVAAVVVIARADSTNLLGGGVLIAMQYGPPSSWRQVRDGCLGAVLPKVFSMRRGEMKEYSRWRHGQKLRRGSGS